MDMTSLSSELSPPVQTELDVLYGECIAPKRYNRYESQQQKSWVELTGPNIDSFLAYVAFGRSASYNNRTLFDEFVTLWVIDARGSILVAIEEGIVTGDSEVLDTFPLARLAAYPEFKLGHPALVACRAARIGGELSMAPEGELHLSNKSGRYGVMRTRAQLENAAMLFSQLGLPAIPQFQPSSWA